MTAAARTASMYDKVLEAVRRSTSPVGAAALAQRMNVPLAAAQRLLALAASRGEVVRLTRDLYSARGRDGVVADPVAERVYPNLSRSAQLAARQRYRPQTVITASGRTVTVSAEVIQARLARKRKAGGSR